MVTPNALTSALVNVLTVHGTLIIDEVARCLITQCGR
jgi:hypothetical protein